MKKQDAAIIIPRPDIRTAEIEIVGTTPLLVHKFSEKSKKTMRDKQGKKAKTGKETRNPEQEFEDAKYITSDKKDGFPALAIKQAIVGSARFIDDLPMTILRGSVMVEVDDMETGLIYLEYRKCIMDECTVRIGQGTTDLRYRPKYHDWSMKLTIRYLANKLSLEQLSNLVQLAGLSQGIGEWRPERDGQMGMFNIKGLA